MKCIMVAAMSKDGYLTRGNDSNPGNWTSDEDKAHYHNMLHMNDLYLMGSRTYSLAKYNLPHSAHKIVMSHNPREQASTTNVEFTSAAFKDILQDYEGRYSQVLVIGGGSVYHQMLDQRLINEAFITIEPVVHGKGVRLATHPSYFEDLGFRLAEQKALNDNGTVLKHYVLSA